MLLPSLSNSLSTKRREADLGRGSVFSVEPGLFWRWGWGLIRGLSGRGRKEPNRKGSVKGGTGIGTAWGSVGRSSVAREGARLSESKMSVQGECTRQKMDTEELETA